MPPSRGRFYGLSALIAHVEKLRAAAVRTVLDVGAGWRMLARRA